MSDNPAKPKIVIDMAKNRIRIHRKTLAALNRPEFILLIVNPTEKTIGVMPGKEHDPGCHRVKTPSVLGSNCYELYSSSLTKKLRQICTDWLSNGKYSMEGDLIPDELVARFYMDKAVFAGTGKVR